MAAYALAAVLVVVAALRYLGDGDGAPRPARVSVEGAPVRERGAGAGRALFVHVAGEVRRPGLYRLSAGSRVAGALERAGGPGRRAELAAVNLAATLEDGQQVVVPRRGAAGAPASSGASSASGATATARARISLASATAEQLDGLDGIGPTLAKRILEYRDEHGGFRSVGQLSAVEGIGEKRLAALKEAVGP